jgi:hypothetical protein
VRKRQGAWSAGHRGIVEEAAGSRTKLWFVILFRKEHAAWRMIKVKRKKIKRKSISFKVIVNCVS